MKYYRIFILRRLFWLCFRENREVIRKEKRLVRRLCSSLCKSGDRERNGKFGIGIKFKGFCDKC